VVGAAALLALALILAVALADSGARHHTAGATTHSTSTSPTNTTPTAATTTTSATSTASTTSGGQQTPATPQQAIANARAAIYQAQTSGQLDPGAANDLNHRLDNIAQALGNNNSQDAAHRLTDLLQHLTDLATHGGALNSAGLAQISTPLNQLAALLPNTAEPPSAPAHGNKGKHGKK
jgi:hypothetical protein